MIVASLVAVLVALVFIGLCACLPRPLRQRFNAVFVAGAGAAYLNGGVGALGMTELLFTTVVTFCALRGLDLWRWIGVAWMLHVGWDVVHHLVEEPILGLDPLSSFGCAICDTVLAIWFFAGAPGPWDGSQDSPARAIPPQPSP